MCVCIHRHTHKECYTNKFLVNGRCPASALFTGRGVDEHHLHPRGLSGPPQLRQVAVVEPGCLHSLEAGRRSRVYPLTDVWQLGEEPGNVRTEPERSHEGLDACAAAP